MFPYKMVDVLTLNGIPYDNNRRSVRIICPFCGKGKLNKDMSIDLDSEKFNCYSCGISGRSATQFYALLNHMTTKEAYGEICSLWSYVKKKYNLRMTFFHHSLQPDSPQPLCS